ncbi:MAG TPA: hypothetical protein VFE23_18780 [Usitatibacter sp.]|jgi:hypothetical protein|nr:hypothetical protein [Usitatibacter sp.]
MALVHEMLHPAGEGDAEDPRAFSIVLGGPLYQLLRRAHISGDALELARRRIVSFAVLGWLPLAVLALLARTHDAAPAVSFLKDIEVHVRFLVAVPLLIAAELLVHLRLRPVAGEFVARDLVPAESLGRFHECLHSAFRLRNSITAEVAMIALIYGLGIPFLWRHFAVLDVPTWYSTPTPDGPHLTLAGYWYAYVSVPIFQFLLLRWYFRIAIWIRFLWQVSRIPLELSAMHGDLCAGLGFLSGTVFAFVPLLMAHGALMGGNIANRVIHAGAKLPDSSIEVVILLAYLLVLMVGPLAVFAPQVAAAKRAANRDYGRLAQRYAREFESKWIGSRESPLGTGDIQSLADLSNSLATVRATRTVPVTREAVVKLALATLAPMAPLLLTVIPARELALRLIKLLL